jgi:hypothetical protein
VNEPTSCCDLHSACAMNFAQARRRHGGGGGAHQEGRHKHGGAPRDA